MHGFFPLGQLDQVPVLEEEGVSVSVCHAGPGSGLNLAPGVRTVFAVAPVRSDGVVCVQVF